ncbi:hypothetical protein CDL15_Pgr018532 [Punica granatum]|uniref:Uncharacterized protein n=1 Tax=Punica granatum TaxID=22663 RepID=A0A218WZ90_PUNGR|nr:hypothetical protein CDL15_Pgr018532 [Punica granatum]PKI37742.1 hypothetical protein CRG98_041859 [Punica granatum]
MLILGGFVMFDWNWGFDRASGVCKRWKFGVKLFFERRESLSFGRWKMDDDSIVHIVGSNGDVNENGIWLGGCMKNRGAEKEEEEEKKDWDGKDGDGSDTKGKEQPWLLVSRLWRRERW